MPGLCLSLYPAGSREGFPRHQHPSCRAVGEVPVCADTLIVCKIVIFASANVQILAKIFSRSCAIFYS
ncbi:hypothetical protein CRH15_07230 [Lelliottia amnigena]|nr:hypothetical protein CO697_18540 [Lelliottia amnigena]PEG65685.1 hypothetical protein CRH15_07230 [Lelliottia amnigena]